MGVVFRRWAGHHSNGRVFSCGRGFSCWLEVLSGCKDPLCAVMEGFFLGEWHLGVLRF